MAFNAKGLTNKGRNLQAKAQAGAELKYTKYVMGDGVLGNQSIALLNNIISPKKNVTVTRVFVVPSDQRANVGMYFTNADVTTGFIWREIGLYALDPDEGEILYWYGYDANGTEIPAGGGSEILEQTFDTLVFVGTAQNISSTVDQSLVFATLSQMNQVLADANAYTDSKLASATIPDASLTVKGKVQLSSSTSSTSQTLAATPKAVNDARQSAITAAQAMDEETVLPTANANAQAFANTATNDIKNNIAANLIPNSTGALGLLGWTNAIGNTTDFYVVPPASGTVHYHFAHNNAQSLTTDSSLLETDGTIVLTANDYTFQIVFYTLGSSDASMDMYAEVYNTSGGAVLAKLTAEKNANWHKKTITFNISAVTVAKVRIVVKGITQNSNRGAARLKLSVGGNSIYTNEPDIMLMKKTSRIPWGAL